MDVSVGHAECDASAASESHVHDNTTVYSSAAADRVIATYRKIHLPGTFEPFKSEDSTNQLEKGYFCPGNLGFEAFRAPDLILGALKKSSASSETTGTVDAIVGMMICNDRCWAEAWRTYGLQGVEPILGGYNTTGWAPDRVGTNKKRSGPAAAKQEALFHKKISIQAGSYQNGCWSINAAKCGMEDGKYPLIGGSAS
jgi:predicted amidohydrolase